MTDNYALLDDGRLVYWPKCKTPGCVNRMNMKAGNGWCWPCQPSGKTFDEVVGELCPALQEGHDHA
jgi:hypothetical protein